MRFRSSFVGSQLLNDIIISKLTAACFIPPHKRLQNAMISENCKDSLFLVLKTGVSDNDDLRTEGSVA